MSTQRDWLSTTEAAKLLGVSPRTMRYWLQEDVIPNVQAKRHMRRMVSRKALEEFRAELEPAPASVRPTKTEAVLRDKPVGGWKVSGTVYANEWRNNIRTGRSYGRWIEETYANPALAAKRIAALTEEYDDVSELRMEFRKVNP